MIETPLELITWDNLKFGHYYCSDIIKTKNRIEFKMVYPFGAAVKGGTYGSMKYAKQYLLGVRSDVPPIIQKQVKVLGLPVSVIINDAAQIDHNTTYKTLAKKHPKVAKYVKSLYVSNWIQTANEQITKSREEYKLKVTTLYNEMITAHTTLGYKKDVENLKELDTLTYCEAEGFLLKFEARINKKSTAKGLKLYKELAKLRNTPVITCETP